MAKKDNKDLAIIILDKLVKEGLVPDCTDTNDETEFSFQDAIEEALNEALPKRKVED